MLGISESMKLLLPRMLALFICFLGCTSCQSSKVPSSGYVPEHGDLLFQSLPNPPGLDLVDAIEGSTGSPFSHCGMVFRDGEKWKVIEAIGPVQIEDLRTWVQRGRNGKFVAYRLNAKLRAKTDQALVAMKKDLGKPYDPRYRFDDEAIYCSELLRRGWQKATGVVLGKDVKLGELNWKPYQAVIAAIEGPGPPPLDRLMITPRDLATAPELSLVYEGR